jgi:tetratricopeptide (TPR) repeat protein
MGEGDRVAPVPVIWGAVPPQNKNFTGRAAVLERLRRSVPSRVTAVLPGDPLQTALRGLGGVGKTAIAIEYAHRYRSDYDVVWWVASEQPELVPSSLAALAGRLGLQDAAASGVESAAKAALDALRQGKPYERWLLIFDNADQPDDIREYIPQGLGDVLITSRNPAWDAVVDAVQVDVFSRPESKEFLGKRAPVQLIDSGSGRVIDKLADKLADRLGDLPLALDQAGAMLTETGMPVDEYIGLLDEKITEIMAEGRSADYPVSVTAAWALSVAKVRESLPQAQELLRCCAFFGPEPIPRDVFRRGTQATGTMVSDLLADQILFSRAIRELGRFALVTIGGRAITIHRLVQALLRDELNEEEQSRYRHDVHAILAAAAPTDPADDRQWRRLSELLPHVVSDATDMARCPDVKVRAFALNVMRYLYLSGDFTSCLAVTEKFIARWTEDSGPDDPLVLGAQRHYGNVLRQLGRFTDSYELVERTLGAARKTLGERDPLTLALRSGLGGERRARGEFAAALALDQETRDLSEVVFGPTNPQTLSITSNLAIDYGLNSDYRRAKELCQSAFKLMSESSSGVSATEVLIAWYNLAWSVRLEGKYTDARDVAQEAWDYGRERLGPDHFATLRTASGLSIALRRIAPAREECLQLARDVYEMCQKRFGPDHPDTLAAVISLSNAQRVNDLLGDALALAEEATDRYSHAYGTVHPYYHGCAGNLALLRRVTGDPERARSLNQAALAGLDERLTRDHIYSLEVAVNLASDYAETDETGLARALGEDSLARLAKVLGRDHPVTLGCAANLVIDLWADGAAEAAESLKADTLGRYAATIGLGHPDAVAAGKGIRLDFDFDPLPT